MRFLKGLFATVNSKFTLRILYVNSKNITTKLVYFEVDLNIGNNDIILNWFSIPKDKT